MNLKTDSHDTEEELKKVREILSNLEATEDSVQEKMVNYFQVLLIFRLELMNLKKIFQVRVRETLKRVSEEVKLSWNSQVKEDLLLGELVAKKLSTPGLNFLKLNINYDDSEFQSPMGRTCDPPSQVRILQLYYEI